MRASILGLLASLALVTGARASVVITVTPLGNPTDSFGDVASGYTAYKLTASTTDGSLITSYNLGGTLGTTYTGITGTLLQQWDVSSDRAGTVRTPTPTKVPAPGLGNNGGLNGQDYGIDTHFLIDPAIEVAAAAPAEDNSGVNPPGSPADVATEDWGTGTFLTGTFGIMGGSQVASQDLAYVVIPTGTIADYNLSISDDFNGGTAYPLAGTIGATQVPEPASLSLLALGGAAILTRRKRG